MENDVAIRQADEMTDTVQPLAYVLAVPLPEQDETYTQQTVPTIIVGCAKED